MQSARRPSIASSTDTSQRRTAISAIAILLSLGIVALATIAVGSTIVARRAAVARDQARQDFAAASRGMDTVVEAVAASKPVKKELLQPALEYYQEFSKAHATDPAMRAEVADARFHMAALHAKMGSKDAVTQMSQGLTLLDEMARDETIDPETVPSLQDSALKVTTPIEWFMVKGADRQYATQLMLSINRATGTYRMLAKKHPQNVSFRDNQSALLKGSALITAQLLQANPKAIEQWVEARDVLETLVKEQPANKDYQVRLAESLVSAARLQKSEKQTDQSIANLRRAVEVGEQLAATYPDDKSLAQNLTIVKRELEKLAAAPPETPAAVVAEKESDAPAEPPAGEPSAETKDAPPPASEPAAEPTPAETKDASPADAPAGDDEPPATP